MSENTASALPGRGTGVLVGILFLAATGFYLAGQAVYNPIMGAPDAMDLAYVQRTRVVAGLLLEMVGVLAIPLIAVAVFPVLKAHAERAAIAYVVFRVMEAMALVVVEVNTLAQVEVSRAHLMGVEFGAAHWAEVGEALRWMSAWSFRVSVAVLFPLGSLLLNAVFFRGRLVPRPIAVWGLAGALLLFLGSVLDMLGILDQVSPVGLEVVLSGPIALQEIVLGLWLIARGFSAPPVPDDAPA